MTTRDFGTELDQLKMQMDEIKRLIEPITNQNTSRASDNDNLHIDNRSFTSDYSFDEPGSIFYSGQYHNQSIRYRWEPQERTVSQLLELDGDKVSKVLTALAHQQRLDILRSVLKQPLTGAELVELLNMGTTGQLYHHIKALLGANLLVQEERGGKYFIPSQRSLPLLLLLASLSDLLDTSDFIALSETKKNAGDYLGDAPDHYDPHHLLYAVIENTILEHQAGYCSEIALFLHADNSITVSDNGRGIPVQALPGKTTTRVQTVLTDLSHYSNGISFLAPGSEKGITMAVVNGLSQKLSVEVRRDGKAFRQDYKHGIPQTDLLTIGITHETGTSVTFAPDSEIFGISFDKAIIAKHVSDISEAYPKLTIHFHADTDSK